MAEPAFLEEEAFTSFPGARSAETGAGSSGTRPGIASTWLFTLNYDRLLEWNLGRFRDELSARGPSVPEPIMPITALPTSGPRSSEVIRLHARQAGTPTRLDQIIAALLRPETLTLLERLGQASGGDATHARLLEFLLTSNRQLHIFAALVDEDLIGVKDEQLHLTELAERVLTRLARDAND